MEENFYKNTKKSASTSAFIGETSRGIAQPVLYDTHTQIFNNRPPVSLITGAPGSGKDLDIETLIPTPYGFVKMKDIKTGDKVLDRSFKPCVVTFAGEIEERQTYRIVLSDNREIIAGENHQWSVTSLTKQQREDSVLMRKRKHWSDLFASNETFLRGLQKNVDFLLKDEEWVTVDKLIKILHSSGILIFGEKTEVEHILHRYAVLSIDDYETKRKANIRVVKKYNIFMSLQALLEEIIEKKHNLFFGDEILTTKEIFDKIKNSEKHFFSIRTIIAKEGTDIHDTGFLTENNLLSEKKDLAELLAKIDSGLEYGNIKRRKYELETHVKNFLQVDELDYGSLGEELFTIKHDDKEKVLRIHFLAHSLGAKSFVSHDGLTVSLELGKIFNNNVDKNNYNHIVSVEKLDKRKTKCISVDSADHTYLATDGFVPTHNTFFAMTLTCLSAVIGKTTVVLDPKGDFLSLKELSNEFGEVTLWQLNDPKKSGILDPFYMAKEDGVKLDLVLETISLFFGELTSEEQRVLTPVIKDTAEEETPSLLLLKENLELSPDKLARSMGTQLDIISSLPFANLCFSPGNLRQKEVSIDEGVTVVTMPGLELSPNLKKGESSSKARLSAAVFFLITDFVRRFMYNSSDTAPKTLIIDEAWAILSNAAGTRVIKEIALLARSKNLALVLVTQNTSHLKGIDVENTIATRFAFRTDAKEGRDIIESMGLPVNEGFERVLTDLNKGECLMQDWKGRYSTVQISQYNEKWKKAFETNPLEKLRKKKAEAERKAKNNQNSVKNRG